MESIRKLENMKKHQVFLPSGFSSNLAALQMVSLQTNTFKFFSRSKMKALLIDQARLRKLEVKSAQYKKLATKASRLTY